MDKASRGVETRDPFSALEDAASLVAQGQAKLRVTTIATTQVNRKASQLLPFICTRSGNLEINLQSTLRKRAPNSNLKEFTLLQASYSGTEGSRNVSL